MKAKKIKKLVEFIKTRKWYIMFFWPAIHYRSNPEQVRSKLNLKLIQIADYCRKHGLRFCAILPERDLAFYATLFKSAGAVTIGVVSKPQEPALTDYEFIVPTKYKLKLSNIIPNCSSVLQLRDFNDDDENDKANQIDDADTGNISKSIIIDVTHDPVDHDQKEILDGNPSYIMKQKFPKQGFVLQDNPYSSVPDIFSTRLAQRISDGNAYIKAVEENMPMHAVPRVQLMGGGGSYTPYPLRGITP